MDIRQRSRSANRGLTRTVRGLSTLAGLSAILLMAAACGGAEQTNLESLVPAGSSLIGKIQLTKILGDEDFAALYAKVSKSDDDPQTIDELLGRVTEEAGIDLHQLSGVIFFADLARGEEPDKGNFGLIAQGSFDESEIVVAGWAAR